MPKKLNIHYCVWAFPGNFDTKRRFSYKFYFVFLVGGGRRSVYFERLVRNLKGRWVDWAKLWRSNITYDFFYHLSIENSITYYINVFCIVLYLLINAIHFFLQSFATYVCIPVTYRMLNSCLFLQRSWEHCSRIHLRKHPLLYRQAYHRSSWDLSSLSAPRTGIRDRPGRFPEVNIQQISLTRTLGLFHENVGSICTFTLLREKM